MTKIIIKEVIVFILLLMAISLVLGIIFYDYIPSGKSVPQKIEAYVLPEDIKEELNENVINGENIVNTYYIDSTDLSAYESTNNYDRGKANPFSDYTKTSGTLNNTTTNNNSNTVGSNNSTENTNKQENFVSGGGKQY